MSRCSASACKTTLSARIAPASSSPKKVATRASTAVSRFAWRASPAVKEPVGPRGAVAVVVAVAVAVVVVVVVAVA